LVDGYAISADIPSPSMSPDQATAVGVAAFSGDNYNSTLQTAIDSLVSRQLIPASTACKNGNPPKNFWYVPQLHGVYYPSNGKFRRPDNGDADLRPPTGNEIKMTIGLALAYGAKGIIPYPFGVDTQANYRSPNYYAYFAGLVTSTPLGGVLCESLD